MGNAQLVLTANTTKNRYDGAVGELASEFAACWEEEERLSCALRELFRNQGPSTTGNEKKQLAQDLVRIRTRIQGLSKGIDKHRAQLQQNEEQLVTTIQNELRQGRSLSDSLSAELVRARKNLQDFDAAFADLQETLARRKQSLEQRQQQALASRPPPPQDVDLGFIKTVGQAIEHDNNRDYQTALTLYKEAIRQADEALVNIKNEGQKELVQTRFKGYKKRAQELQEYLESPPPIFIETVGKAIEHDNNRDFQTALTLYKEAIRQADEALVKIKNEGQKELVQTRFKGYKKRAQELQEYLESPPPIFIETVGKAIEHDNNHDFQTALTDVDLGFIKTVGQAIEHDNNCDYQTALTLYKEAISQADEALVNIKNEGQKELVQTRFKGYKKRAQELQDYLEKTKGQSIV